MELSKYRIAIGYTLKLFSDGLESIINSSDEFSVAQRIPLGDDLLSFLNSSNNLDLLILELSCPSPKSLSFIGNITEAYPSLKILLISYLPGLNLSNRLIESGIDGYLLKTCSGNDLLAAIKKISENKNFFCTDIIKKLLNERKNNNNNSSNEILTTRETEILAKLVDCKTNIQIAKELSLSENTVKAHRKNILTKFGVNNLIGMVRYACRSNLISYDNNGFCQGCPYRVQSLF